MGSEKAIQSDTAKPRMRTRTRILFWLTAWFIVLLPFLFWRSTWFGRPLSDKEIAEYLRDNSKPRHIQHALVQLGERMAKGDRSTEQWYPELARLAAHPVEEIRNTDAWVMGLDTKQDRFHQVLLTMLDDPSPMVRGNAALSLVRFGDATGRPQLREMLQPFTVSAPASGTVTAIGNAGDAANHNTLVARIEEGSKSTAVRAPITGRIRELRAKQGQRVEAGAELMVMDPGTEQVWEALRALYLVGTAEDLPYVAPFKAQTANRPERISKQAAETERAILARAKQ